jgi:hypothetical protein
MVVYCNVTFRKAMGDKEALLLSRTTPRALVLQYWRLYTYNVRVHLQ